MVTQWYDKKEFLHGRYTFLVISYEIGGPLRRRTVSLTERIRTLVLLGTSFPGLYKYGKLGHSPELVFRF